MAAQYLKRCSGPTLFAAFFGLAMASSSRDTSDPMVALPLALADDMSPSRASAAMATVGAQATAVDEDIVEMDGVRDDEIDEDDQDSDDILPENIFWPFLQKDYETAATDLAVYRQQLAVWSHVGGCQLFLGSPDMARRLHLGPRADVGLTIACGLGGDFHNQCFKNGVLNLTFDVASWATAVREEREAHGAGHPEDVCEWHYVLFYVRKVLLAKAHIMIYDQNEGFAQPLALAVLIQSHFDCELVEPLWAKALEDWIQGEARLAAALRAELHEAMAWLLAHWEDALFQWEGSLSRLLRAPLSREGAPAAQDATA